MPATVTTPLRRRARRAGTRLDSPQLITLWRIATACLIGALLTLFVWTHVGTKLSAHTDIVGRTTFANFDINRYLNRFYAVTLLLPFACFAAYFVLLRWGPLRAPASLGRQVPRTNRQTIQPDPAGSPELSKAPQLSKAPGLTWTTSVLRLVLPAGTLLFEVSVARSSRTQVLTHSGIAAALAFPVATLGLATAAAFLLHGYRAWPKRVLTILPAVNALMSVSVLPILWFVSKSTSVLVRSSGRVAHYPWFPGWLAIAVTVAAVAAIGAALAGAPGFPRRRAVEDWVLLILVIPVFLFMVTAQLPGAQGPFQAYDDAQAMVGARLLFYHGLWPWRDIMLLHGFFADALYGLIGMLTFGVTRWGSNAGLSFFVAPLTLFSLYGFLVYFSRRRVLLIAAGCLAVVLGQFAIWQETRYALLPIVLILFHGLIKRATWSRAAAFTVSVIFISIVTPEATILVLGVLATLVLAEIVEGRGTRGLAHRFPRSTRCLASGAVLVLVWTVFLALSGSLAGFVDYYLANISGHQYWGAYPPTWSVTGDLRPTIFFLIPIALWLATMAKLGVKLFRHSPWRPVEWVLVASGTFVPLFYQVVLDRLDAPHVYEVFQAVTPFVVLWGIEASTSVDRAMRVALTRWRRHRALAHSLRVRTAWPTLVRPAELAAVLTLIFLSPLSLGSWKDIPSRFHVTVPEPAPSGFPLGYTTPGAVDTAQLSDLGAILARYAGPRSPVFDLANEIGITYFLLNRVPGVPFYHPDAAQTSQAQKLEIKALERSRPRVVLFYDTTFGYPNIDGIPEMERNYLISQYLLDNYTPFVDVDGQLVMLRNDLVASAPPLPKLLGRPTTTGLHFVLPACSWGDVPDFFYPPSRSVIATGITPPQSWHPSTHTLTISLPPSRSWTSYQWVELSSTADLGRNTFTITDNVRAGPSHDISFNSLPRVGGTAFLRVGSCIQWHGYRTETLTIQATSTTAALSARLLP